MTNNHEAAHRIVRLFKPRYFEINDRLSDFYKNKLIATRNYYINEVENVLNSTHNNFYEQKAVESKEQLLKDKSSKAVKFIVEAVAKRNKWIENRKSQQQELLDLGNELMDVYESNYDFHHKERIIETIIVDIHKLAAK